MFVNIHSHANVDVDAVPRAGKCTFVIMLLV